MKTILLVDDEEFIREFYTQELTEEGYRVVTAATGKEALEIVNQEPPDLIVMDIKMPEMDGIETMIRILGFNPGIPIILNTAYSSYRESSMAWAADEYIVKSSDLSDLKTKIKSLLFKEDDLNTERIINQMTTDEAKLAKIIEMNEEIAKLRNEIRKLKEMKLVKIDTFSQLQFLLHGWVHDFKSCIINTIHLTDYALKHSDAESLKKVKNTYNDVYNNMQSRIQQLYEYVDYGLVKFEPTDIKELVREFVKYKNTVQTEINIILDDYATGKSAIKCNKNQIFQILDNIVNNALKASPKGSTITITLEERSDGIKKEILIIIEDEGSGIPTYIIEELDRSVPLKQNESGLGLRLCKYLIEQHGGKMSIERLFKGTKVILQIPTYVSGS